MSKNDKPADFNQIEYAKKNNIKIKKKNTCTGFVITIEITTF